MIRRGRPGGSGREIENSPVAALARALDLPPGQTVYLEQALTHRSYTRQQGEEERESNERLEFLGDAIVQYVVSILLFDRYPRWSEGQLTRARSSVVSREPLYRAAVRLGLGECLKLGRPEIDRGGRTAPSILASAFEAVAAAVYQVRGPDGATEFLKRALAPELDAVGSAASQIDAKTQFQEQCQALYHKTPVYQTAHSSGPDHDKTYTAQVFLDGEALGNGMGRTKRDAEQAAAQEALETLPSAGRRTAELLRSARGQ